MKKVIKLNESDLARIVDRVINESDQEVNEILGFKKYKHDEKPSSTVHKGKFTLLTFKEGDYFTIAKSDQEFLVLDKKDIKSIEYLLEKAKEELEQ